MVRASWFALAELELSVDSRRGSVVLVAGANRRAGLLRRRTVARCPSSPKQSLKSRVYTNLSTFSSFFSIPLTTSAAPATATMPSATFTGPIDMVDVVSRPERAGAAAAKGWHRVVVAAAPVMHIALMSSRRHPNVNPGR